MQPYSPGHHVTLPGRPTHLDAIHPRGSPGPCRALSPFLISRANALTCAARIDFLDETTMRAASSLQDSKYWYRSSSNLRPFICSTRQQAKNSNEVNLGKVRSWVSSASSFRIRACIIFRRKEAALNRRGGTARRTEIIMLEDHFANTPLMASSRGLTSISHPISRFI
jgi:hypothetical protein